jgi:hypothetical protein
MLASPSCCVLPCHSPGLIPFPFGFTLLPASIIKPYFEERWAEHPDGKTISIDSSLAILKGLHHRWTVVLNGLREKDLPRTFVHPEHGREISLEEAIGMYAWHCRHHLAHITTLKKAKGWS